MDAFQFLASVVHSLAWPATVLVLGLTFRMPLRALIPLVRRARWKDFELDFGHQLDELKKSVPELRTGPSLPKSKQEPLSPPSPSDQTQALLDEAASLANTFPEPAVLVAWKAVETELRQAAERQQIPADTVVRRGSTTVVHALSERGALSPATVDFLSRMRNLRNIAAHPRGINISVDEAREFIAIARDLVYTLRAIPSVDSTAPT